jgi:hypothetical protein
MRPCSCLGDFFSSLCLVSEETILVNNFLAGRLTRFLGEWQCPIHQQQVTRLMFIFSTK